jgi:hypothetical protein
MKRKKNPRVAPDFQLKLTNKSEDLSDFFS